jgi:soluble lytic murein transglycosylase-like protein
MKLILVLLAFAMLTGVSTQARAQEQQPSAPEQQPAAPAQAPSGLEAENAPNTESAADAVGPAMVVREAQPQNQKDMVIGSSRGTPKPAGTGEIVTYVDQTTGNADYDKMIADSAAKNDVDPRLIVAVMRQESGFNQHARSYKGAGGLMQLMPETARRFGVTNLYDPAQNIEGGTKYLRFLLDKFDGDVALALAGYNAGEMAVVGAGYKVPHYRETQNYVRSISARYGAAGKMSVSKHGDTTTKLPNAMVLSSGLSNNY